MQQYPTPMFSLARVADCTGISTSEKHIEVPTEVSLVATFNNIPTDDIIRYAFHLSFYLTG